MSFHLVEPVIYLITKGDATPQNFGLTSREILDTVRLAVGENVSLIQIREKRLPARLLFELTVEAVKITHESPTRLLVNDRADIALAAKANGVHLAADSLAVDVIRTNFPTDFIVGVSTHSLESAASALKGGADFAVFGPVFETPGKGEPQGLGRLSEVCEKLLPFPVIAIGGINESNCESVPDAGASGVAAIRALNNAESMRAIVRKLKK